MPGPRPYRRGMTSAPSSHRRPSPAAILLIPLAVAVVLSLFAWPNARLEPRDVPIGVAAAPMIEKKLAASGDAFEVHRYGTDADAREAIEDREVYGAFVATASGPKVLIASAASPAISQALTHAASEFEAPVEDVVAAKPAGAGLAASVLPMVLAGILTGALSAALTTSAGRRAGLVLAGSVLAGLTATAIVQSWLEIVGGDWLVNAGVLSLAVLAIASTVAGFEALMGKAGLALAAATMILVGNPFSAVSTGPEMLPEPAGAIGQLLPPGAGGNLLRSTGFFDGAAAGGHVAVLSAWVLLGLGALFAAGLRGRRPATAAVPVAA
jgi:hypothetical protein